MSNRGPVITLLAVAALTFVLVGLNVTMISQTASVPPAAEPATTQAPGPPPPAAAPDPPPPAAAEQVPPAAAEQVPPAAPEQATYAGRTSGNEATIAIAVRDGQVAAYLCDGRRVEAWLQGTLEDGRLAVQGARENKATGTIEGDAIFGTVSVDGKQWPYSAQLASPPAGLYQGNATVNGVPNRIGWIVLPDGSQTGIRSSRNGAPAPAPPLDPEALDSEASSGVIVDGIRIDPERVDGDTRVVGVPPA
ncbi:MAG: hypothetical protein ACRDTA_22480 [Pseudonocardiaceae bacterium]